MSFWVKFWGVRGSIACPSPNHVGFGGNTSCLQVYADGTQIVLDAGTGVRGLGQTFLAEGVTRAHILLTHTHWDHINGFPFFMPAYRPGCSLHIKAGHLIDNGGVENVLAGQMARPMFPVPMKELRASLSFEDFRAGESFAIGDAVQVKTARLNHPDGATGYRIEHAGKSICYVTDTEHVPGTPDQRILALIEGADLVIYDCTYTDAEYPSHVGWGHSTWQEGVRLCKAANVRQLAIFHHDPNHEDDFMLAVEREARSAWDGATVAREQTVIRLA